MKAKQRIREKGDGHHLARIAWNTLSNVYRLRQTRDWLLATVGDGPAVEAVREAMDWTIEAAARIADEAAAAGVTRPDIFGDDEREAFVESLTIQQLRIGLEEQERSLRKSRK